VRHPTTGKSLAVEEAKSEYWGEGGRREGGRDGMEKKGMDKCRTKAHLPSLPPSLPSDKGWWLPAGHVDPEETFPQAAYRETLEEAGIGIQIEGLLRVEHRLTKPSSGRMRVVFYGVPIHADAPLKSKPDGESLRAKWVTVKEMRGLRLRSREVIEWAEYVEGGGVIYPLSLLAGEGEPVPKG